MLLADLGADVIVVGGGRSGLPIDAFRRGKSFINLDLKSEAGLEKLKKLVRNVDIVIEGFRPGVMDRLGIGYDNLKEINNRLIYCSLTGYGQVGPLAKEAGHDINYLGLSGALGAIGPSDGAPALPLNIIADFAGGGLYAAYAIMAALFERGISGEGQHIDVAMVDGCISLMAMHYPDWGKPVLASRGKGLLTGESPFYRCYECADRKFIAVGALEKNFFENLWNGLGFDEPIPEYMNRKLWPELTAKFEKEFSRLSRDAWVEHFAGKEACVTPALSPDEVFGNAHVKARHPNSSGDLVPAIPLYSRSLAEPGRNIDARDTFTLLAELGFSKEEIDESIVDNASAEGLMWPPVYDY
ncbi:CoA transferase [Chromohalobacter japonicus]|nr:CoA transferase [Chromohalobacter japonicus]